jgi:hypothetical protein
MAHDFDLNIAGARFAGASHAAHVHHDGPPQEHVAIKPPRAFPKRALRRSMPHPPSTGPLIRCRARRSAAAALWSGSISI